MRKSVVRQRWLEGKTAFCTQLKLKDLAVAELASQMGFDCLWLDLEHHPVSVETAARIMQAARAGTSDVLARPAKGEFMRLGRLLEAGAQGILYPRCDDAAEAREVVRWSKFAPLGERGVDAANADNRYGALPIAQYIQEANRETFLLVQIEAPPAVREAHRMAEVEGVDGLFFGPADYSILSGVPGLLEDDSVLAAAQEVSRAARSAGKRFAGYCASLDHARRLIEMGASFIIYGSDVGQLRTSFQRMLEAFRQLNS